MLGNLSSIWNQCVIRSANGTNSMTRPENTNTINTGVILLQVTLFTKITKWQLTAITHHLERLLMGQLAKTHVTHLNYPNVHRIRQYGVLIIPLSGKLNAIPYKYITQHDTGIPSQHQNSCMEEQLRRKFADFLTSRSFTITPGDIKSISINSWFLCLLMIRSVQP